LPYREVILTLAKLVTPPLIASIVSRAPIVRVCTLESIENDLGKTGFAIERIAGGSRVIHGVMFVLRKQSKREKEAEAYLSKRFGGMYCLRLFLEVRF